VKDEKEIMGGAGICAEEKSAGFCFGRRKQYSDERQRFRRSRYEDKRIHDSILGVRALSVGSGVLLSKNR